MVTEIGKVIEAGAGRARVEVSQSGICAHCELAGSCVPTSGGTRIIDVADPLGVSVNQRVRIELSEGELLGASFLAYAPPLAGLFAGAVIGFMAAGPDSKEMWGGLGAAGGLAAGLYLSRLTANSFSRKGKLTPTIAGVVTDNSDEEIENADENLFR